MTATPGGAVLAALASQLAELETVLAALDQADWDRPSRCAGWTVSDVVLHLAQTNEMAVASLEDRFDDVLDAFIGGLSPTSSVDDGAGALVASERGAPGPAVHARWQAGAAALRAAFASVDHHARVRWVAGELSAQTLATTRLTETWIHTGDVLHAFGRSPRPDDRLWHIARLVWRTVPYAFTRAGRVLRSPVVFDLRSPSGETWSFAPDPEADPTGLTTIRGDALDLCLVAGQRAHAADTSLGGDGPDVGLVLDLVRTFA